MALRRGSLALVAACVLPGVAHAGGKASDAYPRLVHLGRRVCLVYRRDGGELMARCRPEHGTWAEAAAPMQATAAMLQAHTWQPVATAVSPPPAGVVEGTGLGCLFLLGGSLVLLGGTVLAVVLAVPCNGDAGCQAAGYILDSLGVGTMVTGVLTIRGTFGVSGRWDVDSHGLHFSGIR